MEKGAPLLEVVCGAPNARAGLIGVFAPLGTYIPGSKITLEKKPVRGVVSNGMMCSAAELELSDGSRRHHRAAADMAAHVGERYVDVAGLADPVIEVKLTPNRPDCTGVRGIARDLAAAGLGTLKPERAISAVEGADRLPDRRSSSSSRRRRATPVPCSPRATSRAWQERPVARMAAERGSRPSACAPSMRSST